MVTQTGMSEALGRLRYSENEEQVFLSLSIGLSQSISVDTSRLMVDEERVRESLPNNLNALHILAEPLLIYKTRSGDEVTAIVDGSSIDRSNGERPRNDWLSADAALKSNDQRAGQVFGEPQLELQTC